MFPRSGAPMEADAHFRALLNISLGSPVMEPSVKVLVTTTALLHSSVKAPNIWAPLQFPLAGKGPLWREMPISREYLNISSRVPSETVPPPPKAPSMEPHQREKPHPQSPLHPSLKVPGRRAPPPGSPNGAPMERDASLQSLFYISFRVPSKEALPPEPLSTISQSPW